MNACIPPQWLHLEAQIWRVSVDEDRHYSFALALWSRAHRAVALADLRQPTITHHASRAGACRFRRVVRLPLKAALPINRAIDAICEYSFNGRARRAS